MLLHLRFNACMLDTNDMSHGVGWPCLSGSFSLLQVHRARRAHAQLLLPGVPRSSHNGKPTGSDTCDVQCRQCKGEHARHRDVWRATRVGSVQHHPCGHGVVMAHSTLVAASACGSSGHGKVTTDVELDPYKASSGKLLS